MLKSDEPQDLSTARASLHAADSCYADEDYNSAFDGYAMVLAAAHEKDVDTKLRAHSRRSAASFHLGRYKEASEDANEAIMLLHEINADILRSTEHEMCYKRAGMAAFQLKQYKHAFDALELAAKWAITHKRDATQYQDYIKFCLSKMPCPSEQTKASPVEKKGPTSGPKPAPAPAPAPAVAAVPSGRPTMPLYQYYQNDKSMTVAILESNVQTENLRVDFEKKRLTIVLTKQGVDFTVVCGSLYEEIIIDRSKVRVTDEKVLIKMRKKTESFEWQHLISKVEEPLPAGTGTIDDKEIPEVDASKARAYASHRDWNAIERNIEEQEKKETPEGDEALNKLFKDIYKKSNPDTRRAMIKSFQTSGGTVLSTNWDEVAKKDYEKDGPDA